MKVVINNCFGGFSLSPQAALRLYEEGMKELATPVSEYYGPHFMNDDSIVGFKNAIREWRIYKMLPDHTPVFLTVFSEDEKFVISTRPVDRADHRLVRVVEEMGDAANGPSAHLNVIEIPDDVKWHIEEYDGNEHVAQDHETWS